MYIIGSDYDGTIRIDGQVNESSKKAINRFREDGNMFGLVTGRSIESTRKEIKNNNFKFDFVVCNNGGVVFDGDLNLLKLDLIDYDTAMKIIDYIIKYDCDSYVLNDGLRRANKVLKSDYIDMHGSGNGSVSVEEIIKSKKIASIVIGFNEQKKANELGTILKKSFGDNVEVFVNVNCVDIVPKGSDKAKGFNFIIDMFKADKANAYGIGDSYNDIPLIENFNGACLKHSPEDIKKISKFCVGSIEEFIDIVTK